MLSLLLVLAAAPIQPGTGATMLGWSNDGDAVVWTEVITTSSLAHHYFSKSGKRAEVPMATVMAMPEAERKQLKETVASEEVGESQTDEAATLAVVHTVKTGAQVKYFLGSTVLTVQGTGGLQKHFAGLPDAAAFEAWKKANGPAATKGLEGPNGTTASVLVGGKRALSWSAEDAVTIVYAVARGADRATVSMEDQMEAMYVPNRSAEIWWDPSGRRALFAITTAEARTMRGPVGPSSQYFIVAAPPRVEVLAPARLKAEAEQIAGAVEKSGFAVTSIGPATKDRSATVIYAGPAHQEAAMKIAAAIPGATVEKLSWKANGELVVAVGASPK